MARNIELMEKVRDHLRAHPDQHDQHWWFKNCDLPQEAAGRKPECGTAGCVAGWTVVLSGISPEKARLQTWDDLGMDLLGIDQYEADCLFEETTSEEEALGYLDGLIAAGA